MPSRAISSITRHGKGTVPGPGDKVFITLDGHSGTSFGRVGMTATAPRLFADGFESGDTGAWN